MWIIKVMNTAFYNLWDIIMLRFVLTWSINVSKEIAFGLSKSSKITIMVIIAHALHMNMAHLHLQRKGKFLHSMSKRMQSNKRFWHSKHEIEIYFRLLYEKRRISRHRSISIFCFYINQYIPTYFCLVVAWLKISLWKKAHMDYTRKIFHICG